MNFELANIAARVLDAQKKVDTRRRREGLIFLDENSIGKKVK